MTISIHPPFKADHVGSLLRPANLLQARKDYKTGKITAGQLHDIETQELKRIVDKQIEVGLQAVTDGEFRRDWWHIDFLEHLNGIEGYVPDQGFDFEDEETEPYNVRNIGKISFNQDHPFLQDFKTFNQIVDGRAVAKQTIPSPNQLLYVGMRNPDIYPDIEAYADDIVNAYRDALAAFYEAGCRYIQLDDVSIAGFVTENDFIYDHAYSMEQLFDLSIRMVNRVLENKPQDLYVTTHLCRGNYRSTHAFSGAYDKIAPRLFAEEKVDAFFLEYDDERSGTFEALQHIPAGGPNVVIGIFTSKKGELEDKDEMKARIEEASQFVPKSQLCISPQCGFSSTHHGNKLTEQQQWDKLKYVVDIAKETLE
ncbi:5-methyltetrahydropteroyltriglutamate--homocysteine S-methyltransferase [Gracilibacillus salinarum]|uniref:5-methyltetrahydropteroyltriglutamate--homocysteine S-methyltransferase n=1 Tax=Gracilibacillus salinarum TaxID=2932255 RepID=A0ABY4GKE3_9BACI|nr:5-methyltetrahydropteroyltriglutamate--homocysteine S-methyltransferase [Gracilibacillus salinarum]UOQ84838.1 5-methyltetrahydropteroyltriglutamate--homocysteine S-methyltransferase [Gracilibacillus salinarum]